ncbi:MAG TPA: phospholipase D-like domain-containing protein, partial [Allocoleopsis sp.]
MRLLSSIWLRGIVLFLLGLLLVVGFHHWQMSAVPQSATAEAQPPLLEPLPQDPVIQVYFNHAQSAVYTDPYRHFTRPGDDLEQMVVETIASAQTSIDVAVHELTLPYVAQALVAKHRAGVRVRIIIENTYRRSLSQLNQAEVQGLSEREQHKYSEYLQLVDTNQDGSLTREEIHQNDALVMLQSAQVPLIDDTADGSKGSDLMHHKFLVIDGRVVIVGSANLTISDVHGDFSNPASQGNANHLLKIHSPALAQSFTQEFNLMWGDGVGGKPD